MTRMLLSITILTVLAVPFQAAGLDPLVGLHYNPAVNLQNQPLCVFQNVILGSPAGGPAQAPLAVVSKLPEENLGSGYQPPNPQRIPHKWMSPALRPYMIKHKIYEMLDAEAHRKLLEMLEAAKKDRVEILVHSAYRPYLTQCQVFTGKLIQKMQSSKATLEEAIQDVNTRSAMPGQSEHQLGTVVDLVTNIPRMGYQLEYQFHDTKAFAWLKRNAARFGYVMSYPAETAYFYHEVNPRTGYIYEPWHWRYLTPYWAQKFVECRNITAQEYLREIHANPEFVCEKKPDAPPLPLERPRDPPPQEAPRPESHGPG